MEYLFTADSIISFFILVILEIVLGIDNVIFVSIIINRAEKSLTKKGKCVSGWLPVSLFVLSCCWVSAGC